MKGTVPEYDDMPEECLIGILIVTEKISGSESSNKEKLKSRKKKKIRLVHDLYIQSQTSIQESRNIQRGL